MDQNRPHTKKAFYKTQSFGHFGQGLFMFTVVYMLSIFPGTYTTLDMYLWNE